MNQLITSSSLDDKKVIEVRQRLVEDKTVFVVIAYNNAHTSITSSKNGGLCIDIDTDCAEVLSTKVWDTKELAMQDFFRTESRLSKTFH